MHEISRNYANQSIELKRNVRIEKVEQRAGVEEAERGLKAGTSGRDFVNPPLAKL